MFKKPEYQQMDIAAERLRETIYRYSELVELFTRQTQALEREIANYHASDSKSEVRHA